MHNHTDQHDHGYADSDFTSFSSHGLSLPMITPHAYGMFRRGDETTSTTPDPARDSPDFTPPHAG